LLGWESPTYGELCPAISLVYIVQASLPVRIVTAILADDAVQVRESAGQLLLSCDTAEIYQVSMSPLAPFRTRKPRG